MEKTNGIYRVLSNPVIYKTYQDVSGGSKARRCFIQEHVRPLANERLVDIGCGPGQLFELMPDGVSYFGFDLSAAYIDEARVKYQGRATFAQGDCAVALEKLSPQSADVVICAGVLHHIDDNAIRSVFAASFNLLRPGGRFLCLEPVWVPGHPFISRWFMKCDRGKNIKTEGEWLRIARGAFANVTAVIRKDLFRLPYYVVIVTCSRTA